MYINKIVWRKAVRPQSIQRKSLRVPRTSRNAIHALCRALRARHRGDPIIIDRASIKSSFSHIVEYGDDEMANITTHLPVWAVSSVMDLSRILRNIARYEVFAYEEKAIDNLLDFLSTSKEDRIE